jgi:hypothetical protein
VTKIRIAPVCCLAFIAAVFIQAPAKAVTLTYQLLPGATITPYFGADSTGPTEPLSGSFNWTGPVISGGLVGWNATALSFSSPSFLLTLNETSVNDVATSVFASPIKTYFSEVVNIQGMPIDVGRISTWTEGTYVGTPSLPTMLIYPELRISPPNGGYWYARITFTAQLVPEPSTWVMALFAGVALIGFGRARLGLQSSDPR